MHIHKSALISNCGEYRYELRRIWDEGRPPYVVGMLNPSIADAHVDDPTITRCKQRAANLGYGSLIVWNLGAGRARDPKIWKGMTDPIGPENDWHIQRILIECRERNGIAVVGWGTHGSFMNRDRTAVKIANDIGVSLHCLEVTKQGYPKHPLYVSYEKNLFAWSM